MRWKAQASACLLAAAVLAGCNKARENPTPGATGGGAETGTMSDTSHMSDTSSMRRDTGMTGAMSDTGKTGKMSKKAGGARIHPDSAGKNQSKP